MVCKGPRKSQRRILAEPHELTCGARTRRERKKNYGEYHRVDNERGEPVCTIYGSIEPKVERNEGDRQH